MTDFSSILPTLKGQDIYLYLSKESPDWMDSNKSVGLSIHANGKKSVLSLKEEKGLGYLVSSLHHFVDPKNLVLAWGAKDFYTYLKGRSEIPLELEGNKVYDLQILNSYFSLGAEKPSSFKDAVELLKRAFACPGWSRFSEFYFSVYVPLFSKVLPDIETNCLIDNKRRCCIYPFYVVEGQANGRLKASKLNSFSYNPHSLGVQEKKNIRPRDYDQNFVCFDFKNMEVNVLQWVSGDENLGEILKSGKDIYKEIWRKITKQEPTDAHRGLCKKIFLPVVFGMGKASLAMKLDVSEEIASKLIHSFGKTFPVAFDWVKSQSTDSNNIATDVFGRRRKFESHELYKIQNFCIQSPASMICLRKLVRLHEALAPKASICFHVHDGYYVLCNKNEIDFVYEIGRSILEDEENMFPGLRLKTTCQYGSRLDDLKTFKEEVSI